MRTAALVVGVFRFAHQVERGADREQRPDCGPLVVLETRHRRALQFDRRGGFGARRRRGDADTDQRGDAFDE
jgi:hypothetical protein